jgi:predicted transposase/invertase (TIGR01784 family)
MYSDNDFVRLDWAAKNILRDKADFEIFEGLMTVLFGEPVKIVELLESESNREHKEAKSNRVDIKAKNSKDEIILVEIQLEHQTDFLERILFGVSKTITDHLIRGERYSHVKKVYSINILYFNLGVGSDYVYHGSNSFKGMNTGDTLEFSKREKQGYKRRKRANIFPEYYILRVNQYEKERAETPLEEWMQYLKIGYIRPDTTAPGLQKAREKLRILSMSDEERRSYERYLDNKLYEEDVVETAHEDGWFEGYDEAILEMVQKLKDEGMDDETISRITGH